MTDLIICSIYVANNVINGKKYIGFTTNFENRLYEHKNLHQNIRNPTYNSVFYRAIRKYGWNNFEWEIIAQSKDANYMLNVAEPHFIKYCNTHYITGYGYNMTYGGEGTLGRKATEKEKEANSLRNLGKQIPKDVSLKISKSLIESAKKTGLAKFWIITDPDGNTFRIQSLGDFCRNHGLNQSNMIKVANGKISHNKGYKVVRDFYPRN